MNGEEEAVGGVVVARYGVNTIDVITRRKGEDRRSQTGLPAGLRIMPFYDRSSLIDGPSPPSGAH